ncbi:hypothetical protein NKH91_17825 [Mesorhizobium sp. M0894]
MSYINNTFGYMVIGWFIACWVGLALFVAAPFYRDYRKRRRDGRSSRAD